MVCCILAGDTDGGGLAIVIPVSGLMMGMADPRARVAEGWCSFRLTEDRPDDCWVWKAGGMKGGEDELSEKAGATEVGCCVGEDSGEELANDERSEALLM